MPLAAIANSVTDYITKISIKDAGPGIPEEKILHLFDRYYRTEYQGGH